MGPSYLHGRPIPGPLKQRSHPALLQFFGPLQIECRHDAVFFQHGPGDRIVWSAEPNKALRVFAVERRSQNPAWRNKRAAIRLRPEIRRDMPELIEARGASGFAGKLVEN